MPQAEAVLDAREVFSPQPLSDFSRLMERRLELKATMKEAEEELKSLDEGISQLLTEHDTLKVQYGDATVSLVQGSRSSISKERLVELGVPASTVQAATKTTSYTYVLVR